MDQALETITRRINALGLTEPTIAFTGRADNEILVQLPGEGDPTRAKSVIQAGGQLAAQTPRATNKPILRKWRRWPLTAACCRPAPKSSPANRKATRPARRLSRSITFSTARRSLPARICAARRPQPSTNNPGQYDVEFTLSTAAAARFGPFTEANVGKRMAIVLDNQVYTAPVINSRIEDRGEITGNFSQESGQDLALVLKAGALPASIKYLEERTVGPSLGADSIREGVRASIGSIIVVMIFLLIYYRQSGVNAVVALTLNLIILVAFMAYVGSRADAAGHRRRDPDHRHGRRFQRACF